MESYMTKDDDIIQSLINQLSLKPTDGDSIEALADKLRKRLYETALTAELDSHLGYSKHARSAKPCSNSRNGYSKKTLKGNKAQIEIAVPRDRNASFEPQIIKKHQTRTGVLDEQIIALYAKGMTTREIADTLQEFYDVDVSATLISHVTDKMIEELTEWQNRPLDNVYPIVYLDCIVLKVRENQRIVNKSIDVALGVNLAGHKELLGLWTTNAIESLNSVIRKATKRHKLFPNDEAALKVVYLASHEASKKWTMPIRNWRQALNQFSIAFGDRVLNHL